MDQGELTKLFGDFICLKIPMESYKVELLHIWSHQPYDGSPDLYFRRPDAVGERIVCEIEGVAKRNKMILGNFSSCLTLGQPRRLIVLTDDVDENAPRIIGFELH